MSDTERLLAEELVQVVRMESEGRVLDLSVEDRARRWAIGIARRLDAARATPVDGLREALERHTPEPANGPFIGCSCDWESATGEGSEWAAHFSAALATDNPARATPVDGLLDAIRAYGDARADVAYGRTTRKAIDLAWDRILAVGGIPPMDQRDEGLTIALAADNPARKPER